ncbi:MAG: enoyl-CoA hydratase/isomerase family protein [Mycobacteriales bacterium]
MGEFVRLEVQGGTGVGTVRLDRPPMNALNTQLWTEIGEVADEAERRDDVRAVVLWGGPKIFAAGADIKDLQTLDSRGYRELGTLLQKSFARLAGLSKITISAVNGYALGGGCELALTTDLRYAATDAVFGQPEILLGIIPGAGGTQRLQRLVGLGRAKELVYTGRRVAADEALAIGLVNAVFPADEVYRRAVEAAERFAAGPYALRLAKHALDAGGEQSLPQALELETELLAACFGTEDATIGFQSFLQHGPGKAQFVQR